MAEEPTVYPDWRALIDALGQDRLTQVTGMNASTVRGWRHFNVLPRVHWPAIQMTWAEVTVAVLLAVEAATDAARPPYVPPTPEHFTSRYRRSRR